MQLPVEPDRSRKQKYGRRCEEREAFRADLEVAERDGNGIMRPIGQYRGSSWHAAEVRLLAAHIADFTCFCRRPVSTPKGGEHLAAQVDCVLTGL
jgi:hypothetical protein